MNILYYDVDEGPLTEQKRRIWWYRTMLSITVTKRRWNLHKTFCINFHAGDPILNGYHRDVSNAEIMDNRNMAKPFSSFP